MHATPESTIRELVAADFRSAAVFDRYGIDFCCGGGKTVAEACREHHLNAGDVLEEVTRVCRLPETGAPRFSEWDPETLIAYIVGNHHAYVRRTLPAIEAYTRKLVTVHGERHPELHEVAHLVEAVSAEMTMHMAKEEQMLFPYIAAAAAAARGGDEPPLAPFGHIDSPIRMMEAEHEAAGAAMARIRTLTDGYAPPEDACTTYRVCLQELEVFEEDLHRHVHLENNILFPAARALDLEREVRRS
jgi:regulator of cell morphogenesis and NO signaling